MHRPLMAALVLGVGFSGVTACGGGGKRNVQRVSTNTQTDLSGNWNDTDAKLTSEKLISDCFTSAWLDKYSKEKGRPPVVRVHGIINKTDEHIDAQVFVKNIERAMVNSGKVEVVAQGGNELGSVNAEQDYGAGGRVSDESAASIGQQSGADFVLVGRMASIVDQVEGEKAKFYKITFELINATSSKKVWIGDHEIKKVVTQAGHSW
ncbi:MAG: penicillin-binding protein activator LpoB [Clostridia bacterium]|nr:penicillin-binding protein activator LpoB [Deltaproteobacteria bacterium]